MYVMINGSVSSKMILKKKVCKIRKNDDEEKEKEKRPKPLKGQSIKVNIILFKTFVDLKHPIQNVHVVLELLVFVNLIMRL